MGCTWVGVGVPAAEWRVECWTPSRLTPPLCSAAGPTEAFGAADLIPYLLGNFETVQQVAEFMDAGTLQVGAGGWVQ